MIPKPDTWDDDIPSWMVKKQMKYDESVMEVSAIIITNNPMDEYLPDGFTKKGTIYNMKKDS